jgi:hypothetical protein
MTFPAVATNPKSMRGPNAAGALTVLDLKGVEERQSSPLAHLKLIGADRNASQVAAAVNKNPTHKGDLNMASLTNFSYL